MTNPNAEKGIRLEHDVRAQLRANGYDVIRSAASKTPVDLIALKPGQIVLVQCKYRGTIPPAERAELLRIARLINGLVPVVASRREARGDRMVGIVYRRLVGPGPKDFQPWSPDAVIAAEWCPACGRPHRAATGRVPPSRPNDTRAP